jgi:hypothetical protein
MADYVLRFFIGGLVVSGFAVLGDIFRPKSFAGLFGAAPSIAIATLGMTIWQHGGTYAAIEGRSMIFGAIALGLYSFAVCQLLKRFRYPVWFATAVALTIWFTVGFGLKSLLLG